MLETFDTPQQCSANTFCWNQSTSIHQLQLQLRIFEQYFRSIPIWPSRQFSFPTSQVKQCFDNVIVLCTIMHSIRICSFRNCRFSVI